MMRAKVLFLFGLACTGVLSARTVALWPLEVTADGRFDGRCAIDSQNDLGAIDESWRVDAGIGRCRRIRTRVRSASARR